MQKESSLMKMKRSSLLLLSGSIWLAIGIMLVNLGSSFLVKSLEIAKKTPDETPLLHFLGAYISSPENVAILIITLAIFIGYIKGNSVMKKQAIRTYDRIFALPHHNSITKLYTKKNLLIIAFMMSLGFLMKFCKVSPDIRGFVDIAVGSALIQGSMHQFRYVKHIKKNEEESSHSA